MSDVAERTSVIVPAFNEAHAIGQLVSQLQAAARWQEILVVDDGSTDGTGGAAVKTGIRHAVGAFVLIVDGDGQHGPSDATRLVIHLNEYELVVGARQPSSQAGWLHGIGNRVLNTIAGHLASHQIPDLTSGFRAGRVSARIPASAAQRVLDTDDHHAGVLESCAQRALRAGRGGSAAGIV
jgi:glycosyltransferase involved in cell wall biosynthesis